MGSSISMKDDIEDSEVREYTELNYKLFQLRDYQVRSSNGGFRCPFCTSRESRDEDNYKYTHLLQHAIRVGEGSISGKQRCKHAAMARYLAVDLGSEVNAEEDKQSSVEERRVAPTPTTRKRSRSDGSTTTKNTSTSKTVQKPPRRKPSASLISQKLATADKREKEALEKVSELESKINKMTDEMNALIMRESSSNEELQGVRKELTKREKEALHKASALERKINEMNTLIRKERSSNDELQRVRREVMKRENEALDKVRELQRKISETNALIAKERTSNCEMQRVHKELMKRENEALDNVRDLEKKINEMSDKMNALTKKERSSNDELQRVRKELMKEKSQKNLLKEKEESDRAYWSLLAREQKSNAELQEARNELLKVLNDLQLGNSLGIGIKQMGEIDVEVFKRVCSKKFRASEAEIAAVALCSSWQQKLKNPDWDPFQMVKDDNGNIKRVVKVEDELLRGLKQRWGEEAYTEVVRVLEDLQEHNPSGRYAVPELWNFDENRKAKLEEIIRHFSSQLQEMV